jgi:SWI/SNF-related matrix-associated actin-dependent regulator 1 of chromatin subfamily A
VNLRYFSFQRAGIEFLASRTAALLADDMGLGKSIQVCGLLNLRTEIRRVLIVCPASLKTNWCRELDRWLLAPQRSIQIWNGDTQTPPADIVIINYDLLGRFENLLKSQPWDLIVFDEAHYLKSPNAQRTRLAKSLCVCTPRKVLLTGTPLLNRPAELWSLLNLLAPARWPNYYAYAHRYCDPKQTQWGWDFRGASHLEELVAKLRGGGLILRRRKSEVLPQLPRVTRQVIVLSGTSTLLNELEQKLSRELGLSELPASLDPERVPFELISQIRRLTGEVKIGPAISFIEEQTGEYDAKVVLFAHHQNVLTALGDAFKNRSTLITGQTQLKTRQEALDAFQTDPNIKYFIASTHAMGIGVTLTASSHVIFVEADWTPAVLEQAEARLHRIGQQSGSVLAQYLVLENSIDEKILTAVQAKLTVINQIIES